MVWTNQVQNLVLVAGTGISGVFVYDPSAAAGNLIASLTDAAADSFGNVTEKGVCAYVTDLNGIREAVNLNASSVNGLAGLSIQDTAHPPSGPPGVYGVGSGTGGSSRAIVFMDSGVVAPADTDAVVTVASATDSAFANGVIGLDSGRVDIGNSPSVTVNDNTGAVTAIRGSAATPTLITTDTWHAITPGGSWSNSGNGVNGFFYRLLSTGDVLLVWDVSISSATPGTLGTLPAGYRPATAVNVSSGWYGTGPVAYNDQFSPHLSISTGGVITGAGLFVATISLFGGFILPIGSL